MRFVLRLMEEMRSAIAEGSFESYRREFHANFTPPDQETRRVQRRKWLEAQRQPRAR